MTVKYITVKGSENLGRSPFYVGLVQHDRTMSSREAYEYIAQWTGYKATAVRAVFLAMAEYIRENQRKGNITFINGVASIRNYVRGAFDGLAGPWVKGCPSGGPTGDGQIPNWRISRSCLPCPYQTSRCSP